MPKLNQTGILTYFHISQCSVEVTLYYNESVKHGICRIPSGDDIKHRHQSWPFSCFLLSLVVKMNWFYYITCIMRRLLSNGIHRPR